MRSSSGMNGSFTAWLPAAMMALANLTVFLPSGRDHFEMVRVEEGADAGHHLDLARLRHAGKAAGQLLDHAVLERAQLVEVDLRRAEGDAVVGRDA